MKAKLLLQMLCKEGVGWDHPRTENKEVQWKQWLADLPKLQVMRVDRSFEPVGFSVLKEIKLHHFSDISRLGCSSQTPRDLVAPLFRRYQWTDSLHVCYGKARLAPLQKISIPGLKLTASVISVNFPQDHTGRVEPEDRNNFRHIPRLSGSALAT